MHWGGPGLIRHRWCWLRGGDRGCRARLARFLPRPGLGFLARTLRGGGCLTRLFAFQRRQHFLQIIGTGKRFLRALRFGPLGGAGLTLAQPGLGNLRIQSLCRMPKFRFCRHNQARFCSGDAIASLGLGMDQVQHLNLSPDLPCNALQDQKAAQGLIRRGRLRKERFRRPQGQAPHGRHHGRKGSRAGGCFVKGSRRFSFGVLFAVQRGFQGAFGFLHARCHGNALAREAAFFRRRRFGFARGSLRRRAAGSTSAAGFLQRLTRRLREREAWQSQ